MSANANIIKLSRFHDIFVISSVNLMQLSASVNVWSKTLWSLALSSCFDKLCNLSVKLFQIRTPYLEKDYFTSSIDVSFSWCTYRFVHYVLFGLLHFSSMARRSQMSWSYPFCSEHRETERGGFDSLCVVSPTSKSRFWLSGTV